MPHEVTPDMVLGRGQLYVDFVFQEGYGSAAWKEYVFRNTFLLFEPMDDLLRFTAGLTIQRERPALWPAAWVEVRLGHYGFLTGPGVYDRWTRPIDPGNGTGDVVVVWSREYLEPGSDADRTHRAVAHGLGHVLQRRHPHTALPAHDTDPHSVMHPSLTQTFVEPHWPARRLAEMRANVTAFNARWGN